MRPSAPWPLVCLLACVTGCQAWPAARTGEPRPLGTAGDAKPAPRTIPVELVFVRFDEHDSALRDELWNEVDEQAVADGLRRRLAVNGLRAGIVTGDLPPALAARLLPDRVETAGAAEPLTAQPALTHRRLRLLPGRRGEIIAAAGIAELVLLETDDDKVRGGTFHDATSLFELTVRPAADGRVRVELVPEIKHGPLEKQWVGEDGVFRMEAAQRRHRRDDLALGLELREGDLLVVGCVGERGTTLGDALLRDHGSERSTLRLLAVRPLGRAIDPLFAPEGGMEGDDGSAPLEIR